MSIYTVQCLIDDLSLVEDRKAKIFALVDVGGESRHIDIYETAHSLQTHLETHVSGDLSICLCYVDGGDTKRRLVYKLAESSDPNELILYESDLPFRGKDRDVFMMHIGGGHKLQPYMGILALNIPIISEIIQS